MIDPAIFARAAAMMEEHQLRHNARAYRAILGARGIVIEAIDHSRGRHGARREVLYREISNVRVDKALAKIIYELGLIDELFRRRFEELDRDEKRRAELDAMGWPLPKAEVPA